MQVLRPRMAAIAGLLCLLPITLPAQTVYREVLPSGLTLIIDDRGLTHAVELRAFVTAGPAHEGELLGSGVSGVVMRLLTDAVRAGRIQNLGELHAGDRLRSELSAGATSFALTTSDRFVSEGLRLLAGVLTHREYDAAAVVQARELNLQNIVTQAAVPRAVELQALRATLLRQHPSRLPLLGLPKQLGNLDLDSVRRYHRSRYTAPNTTVIVVGNVDVDQVRALVATAFAEQPVGSWAPLPVVTEPAQYRERHTVRRGPGLQERHIYAWRTVGPEHRDHAVIAVVASLLADPQAGLLAGAMEAGQLASELEVLVRAAPDEPAFLQLGYNPFPERGAEAWLAVQQVLDRLAQEGPSDSQLNAAKRQLLRERTRAQSQVAAIAADIERWERAIGVPDYGEAVLEHVATVSLDDVKRVAGTWLHPNGRNRSKLVLRPLGDAQAADEPIQPGLTLADVPPTVEEVGGGLRLLYRRLPIGLAHLRVTIVGGSACDPPERRGASALLAKLLAVGPTGRSGEALQRELAERGMHLTTTTRLHTIELGLTCFPQDVPEALRLLVDIIKDPALPEEDLNRLKQATLAEIALSNQSPDWDLAVMRAVRATTLGDHYGAASALGTRDSLADLDRSTLLAHHQEMACGARTVLSIYGEFDAADAIGRLRRLVAAEPPLDPGQPWQPTGSAWPEIAPPSLTTLTWPRQTSAVALAWPGPPLERLGEDGAAMDVLTALLAGQTGSSGRLGKALGEAQVPIQEMKVSAEAYAARGLWVMRALVPEARREAAARTLREAVLRLEQQLAVAADAAQALPEEELQAARSRCVVTRVLAREDQDAAIGAHARALLLRGGSEQDLAYEKRVMAVTRDDLLRVMRAYLGQTPAEVRLVPTSVPQPVVAPSAPTETVADEPGEGDVQP
jgi:zinc protease